MTVDETSLSRVNDTSAHTKTLDLFFATQVRALVRNPNKLEVTHDNLTVISGDVGNLEQVRMTCEGADFVIVCVAGPNQPNVYPHGFMREFVEQRLWPTVREIKPQSVLYQAAAFCPLPDGTLPFALKMTRNTIARMVGIIPMIEDNDSVIKYIHENPLPDTKVIVTRPGRLMEGEGGLRLEASESPEMNSISFQDVGHFNLRAMKDELLVGKYPFIKIQK
jgi:hypothetical protein